MSKKRKNRSKKLIKSRNELIYLILIALFLILLFLLIYLYVPIGVKSNIYIDVNSKFNISDYKAKLRNKNISLYCDDEIKTNKVDKYYVSFYTKEEGIINIKRKILIHIVDNIKPVISLNGEKKVSVSINGSYEELGVSVSDNYDKDLSKNVKIVGEVNTKKAGEYTITYKVKDSSNNESSINRIVVVKNTDAPVIELNRNVNSYLILNDKIDINDFTAYDTQDGDLTKKVKVDGSVDNTKEGLYTVKYSVSDSDDNETIVVSTINVQEKNTSGIPVLMYHWFFDDTKGETYEEDNNHNYLSKTNFEEQVKYLVENNYYFVTYDELEQYIDKKIDLPKKSVILTDDDNKESFFVVAGDIIQKYKVPMTSFVITNTDNWKDHIDNEYIVFESHTDSLHVRSCRTKKLNGAAMCATEEELISDLKTASDKLTKVLNTDIEVFAYPFGHYSDDFQTALKENNIHLAFTTKSGKVKPGMNKLLLPRVRVSRTTTLKEFISSL